VIRRGFWIALGLGAGATAAIIASRWMKRKTEAMAPTNIAREARDTAANLGQLVRESLAEFRKGMADREAEIRAGLAE
jgi:sensor histidine kinase regulating citrate/malate metabolism